MAQGTTCLGDPHLFKSIIGSKDTAYLYTEYHEHQWHMSAPYKPKKTAYQHNGGDCPDPEGPNFADLQTTHAAYWEANHQCSVLSDMGVFVSDICASWHAQDGFELTAVRLHTTAHSLLFLAGRRFLVFLFIVSPPIHVGVGVVCMICL